MAFHKCAQSDISAAAYKRCLIVVARNSIEIILPNDGKAAIGVHDFWCELIHCLGIGDYGLLCVDLCHAHRPAAGQSELLMVQILLLVESGTLDATADAHLKHLASLCIGAIDQSGQCTDCLITYHIRCFFHGIGLYHYAGCRQEIPAVILIHQANQALVVESGIALWLFRRLLKRSAGAALVAIFMSEVATTDEILLVKVVL